MRQTIPTILVGRNDIVAVDGQWYQVVQTRIQPCELYPKVIVVADTWPHHAERVAIELDADAYIARAVS